MKTAVEWLCEQYHLKQEIEIVQQAKEMEKQQGYSEEDMIAFGEFIFKNTLLVNVKGVEGILEQFKNK
jgi:hypothetical protein